MTLINDYQTAYPDTNDDILYNMIACDAFIRRMGVSGFDVMVKGSFITRQFFGQLNDRLPQDLDVIFIRHLDNVDDAEHLFDEWLTAITRIDYIDDGVTFIPFNRTEPWEDLDYSMSQSQDFPTVNTEEVYCTIDGKQLKLSIDISFNLQMPLPSTPLLYRTPIDDIYLPAVPSVSVQVAWKIHQLLVHARLKDMYDLTELLPKLGNDEKREVIELLTIECKRDNIPLRKIKAFTKGENVINDYVLNAASSKTHIFFDNERSWSLAYCPKLGETYQEVRQALLDSVKASGLVEWA